MNPSRLTALQQEVLEILAPVTPPWTLTGGAALAGFHLGHRTTRDLDLFWHGRNTIEEESRTVERQLVAAGLEVAVLRRSETFVRMQVGRRVDSVVLDLVAEPVPVADAPREERIGTRTIRVDTAQEILTNKLGMLLHRAEPRDLVDIRALLGAGCDLERALAGAARKDGGFSALTVGWALQNFDVKTRAGALGMRSAEVQELDAFRLQLLDRIARLARP